MSAVRHSIHTNLGLDVVAVEAERVRRVETPPHVDPNAREEMREGWLPDHGTNFGIVLPVDETAERAGAVVIVDLPAVRVLAVEERAEMASIGDAMQSAFGRLFAAVERVGANVIGAPLSRYPEMPSDQVHFQLCVPIAPGVLDLVESGADVHDVVIPERRAATMRFRGPYEEMAPAWKALTTWVGDHDHVIAGPLEEIYLDDPDTCGPDGPETMMVVPIG